jgi:Tfp pilus assembly protein PilV
VSCRFDDPAVFERLYRKRTAAKRTAAAAENGFALVEILAAILVLSVGILALFGSLTSSRGLTRDSERLEIVAHRAQDEIERVHAIPYAKVALDGVPATSADPKNPAYYVKPGSPTAYQWDRNVPATEPLVIDTATPGSISAVPKTWSESGLSGKVYDYVTWATDGGCGSGCPASANYKRISVAVTIDGPGRPSSFILVSSFMVDPDAKPSGAITNGTQNPLTDPTTKCQNPQGQLVDCTNGIGTGTANTWFLYDTPATSSARAAITGDHATHRTVAPVGTCSGGNTTGCPVPDLMGTTAPPTATPTPTLYKYSNEQSGTYTGGRVLRRDVDCSATPSATDNSKGELWVTNPLTAAKTLTGVGGMIIHTQTLGGASANVTFCAAFYDVPGSITNLVASPPTKLGAVSYTPAQWPQSLDQISFVFDFLGATSSVKVASGRRIGVRIWATATSDADIAVAYDHPSYPAQVQLNSL